VKIKQYRINKSSTKIQHSRTTFNWKANTT